jgi:chemotaxis signal transduction protein
MESNRASSSAPEIAELVQEARVAREQARRIESLPEERKLLFVLRISGILVGLPALFVQAVIAADTPCPLPLAPAHLLGLVPHSEGALAVVDLARFLELGTTTVEAGASRIVVIRSGELEAGVLCEQALGVHSAGVDEIDRDYVVHAGQLTTYTTFECQLACGRVASLDHTRLLQAMQLRA